MFDLQEISLNMCVLTVIYTLISHYPKLKNYTTDIKFSVYRSLMCITFGSMGLNILVNYISTGISHPFSFKNDDMMELYQLFTAYIVFDLIQMFAYKSKRYDLYVHHILCIAGLIVSSITNRFGYIHSILLIGELLSVVSGIDSIAMHENELKLSYYCKKIRKTIIKYIRYPLWIILLVYTIRFTNKTPNLLWYYCIGSSIIMMVLDNFWEAKCDKVIDKYLEPVAIIT